MWRALLLTGAAALVPSTPVAPSVGSRRIVKMAVSAELGPALQPLPVISSLAIGAAFAWLNVRVRAYNDAADEWDVATVRLREAKVAQLTSGKDDSADAVTAAQASVDETTRRMDEARAVTLGPLTARIRVARRGADALEPHRRAEKATAATRDGNQEPSPFLQLAALTFMVGLLLPLLALMAADPMAPPSPELSRAFEAADQALGETQQFRPQQQQQQQQRQQQEPATFDIS